MWNGGYYSDPQRVRIAEQANYLLKKRHRLPQFRDYLVCVMAPSRAGVGGAGHLAHASLRRWRRPAKKNTEDFWT